MGFAEKFGVALGGQENFLADGAHPAFGSHFVGHGDEVDGADAITRVPAGAFWVELRGAFSELVENFDNRFGISFAGDFGDGELPFFASGAHGVEEAGRSASIPVGPQLIDGRGVRNGRSEPLSLGDGEQGERKGEYSNDHQSLRG